ncbi:MAG TPA: hypothetical protein VEV37_01110 [Bryobacteraceae bacterium]|nr:hypothetical protein [Bryobacteraceae bacterium]
MNRGEVAVGAENRRAELIEIDAVIAGADTRCRDVLVALEMKPNGVAVYNNGMGRRSVRWVQRR